MGKQKKKEGKKAKAPKLPKQIAGIKIPKELREPGGRLLKAVQDPMVIEVAAAALAAAAGRLRSGGSATAPAAAASEPAKRKGGDGIVGDIATALAASAIEGLRKLGDADQAGPKEGERRGRRRPVQQR